MSKSNLHEKAYLKLVFQNIALYSSDPTDTDSGLCN